MDGLNWFWCLKGSRRHQVHLAVPLRCQLCTWGQDGRDRFVRLCVRSRIVKTLTVSWRRHLAHSRGFRVSFRLVSGRREIFDLQPQSLILFF